MECSKMVLQDIVVLADRKHHSSIRMAWIADMIEIAASYFAPVLCVYFTYITS